MKTSTSSAPHWLSEKAHLLTTSASDAVAEPAWLVAGTLVIGAVAAAACGNRVIRQRVVTWWVAAAVIGGPLLLGPWGAAGLAAVLGVIAVREASALVGLTGSERLLSATMVAASPFAVHGLGMRGVCLMILVLPVLCSVPALLAADAEAGVRRAAACMFTSVWVAVGTTPLVLLDRRHAIAVCFAVAMADVGAWCAGKALGRSGPLSRKISAVSPNKTLAGLIGAALIAAVALGLAGQLSVAVWAAVAIGGVVGDLLESLVKRNAGVKDAGSWVPGFGGLLDRVDSLLVALPLAVLPMVVGIR